MSGERGWAFAFALIAALGVASQAAEIQATVTDAGGKPVEDAVVFVYEAAGEFQPPEAPALMDQVGREFVPHLLPVLAGSKVRFPNKDDIHHHLYSFSSAKTFELPLYKGEPAAPVVFDKAGVVKLGCNIHDWMSGIILVLPTPYFARTGPDGKATLAVPDAAAVELAVFHERLKGPVDATRRKVKASGAPSWKLTLKGEKKKKKRSSAGYP